MKIKDAALAAKLKTETVEIPEWGVTVSVREMTGRDRAHFTKLSVGEKFEEMWPDVVIACTFDVETGESAFEKADRDALKAVSASALDRIATTALRLSGMDLKAIDEAEKNSERASGEFIFGSPATSE